MTKSNTPESRAASEFPAAKDLRDSGPASTYLIWSCGPLQHDGETLEPSTIHTIPDAFAAKTPCLRRLDPIEHEDGKLSAVGRKVEADIQAFEAAGDKYEVRDLIDRARRELQPRE